MCSTRYGVVAEKTLCGVQQGANLGPPLLFLHVRNILKKLKSVMNIKKLETGQKDNSLI